MVYPHGDTTIPQFSIGDLVGHGQRFLRVLGVDRNGGLIIYWCRAVPGTKYFTLREQDLRKLE